MAFGHSEAIWGRKLLPQVQQNQIAIANTIAQFEPVTMLVHERDFANARQALNRRVQLVKRPIDDLWMRDTGPVFVRGAGGRRAGIDFNFNGWGGKQAHRGDAKVARWVTALTKVERVRSTLVLEGGGVEVDGEGSAIITESCVLNRNRNPGVSKAACEAELRRVLGIRKVIWLPGRCRRGHYRRTYGLLCPVRPAECCGRWTGAGSGSFGLQADPGTSEDPAVGNGRERARLESRTAGCADAFTLPRRRR